MALVAAAGVSATALASTVERAAAEGLIAAAWNRATPGGGSDPIAIRDSIPGLDRASQRDAAGFELFFPGAGHAPDNIVVYFTGSRVLFGGCLLKPDSATTVGNVAEWPRAIARVASRYAQATTVIPGHGAVSGHESLTLTQALITTKGPAAAETFRRRQNTP